MTRRAILFYAVLTIVLALTLSIDHRSRTALEADLRNTSGPPPAIGTRAPEFTVVDSSGTTLSSKDMQGKDYLLIIWNMSCEPSRSLLLRIDHIVRDLTPENLAVLPVSILDSVDEIRGFFVEHSLLLKPYADCNRSVKWGFNANTTPAVYIINRHGEIVYRQLGIGPESMQYLEQKIRQYARVTPQASQLRGALALTRV